MHGKLHEGKDLKILHHCELSSRYTLASYKSTVHFGIATLFPSECKTCAIRESFYPC